MLNSAQLSYPIDLTNRPYKAQTPMLAPGLTMSKSQVLQFPAPSPATHFHFHLLSLSIHPAWQGIHTNNSAQLSYPIDLTTSLLQSPSTSAPAPGITLSPQVMSALAAASPAPAAMRPKMNLRTQAALD